MERPAGDPACDGWSDERASRSGIVELHSTLSQTAAAHTHIATQALNTKFQTENHSTFLQEDGRPAPDRLREVHDR